MNSTRVKPEPIFFSKPIHQEKRGAVKLTVGISPADVPTSIEGCYNEALQRFVINFSYPGDEEGTKEVEVAAHLVGLEGVTTGRLRGLIVDVHELGVQHVSLELLPILKSRLDEAVKNFQQKAGSFSSRLEQRSGISGRILDSVNEHYISQLIPQSA